jgi:tRNA(Ile)-lysidine synthase
VNPIKFLSAVEKINKTTSIGVAVSGGLDSVCMLEMFIQSGFKNLVLLHVNYGLRKNESDEDELFVRNLAKIKKIKIMVLDAKKDMATFLSTKTGIQEKARLLRYEWFEKLVLKDKVKKIATAHHAQDLAETFLINAIRKSGMKGLSSIPEKQQFVIRPLLHYSKEEIKAFALQNKLEWREDSSNLKANYTRNLIRLKVFPLLETHRKGAVQNIQETVFQLKQEQSLLESLWQEKWSELISAYPQAIWSVGSDRLMACKESLLMLYYALRNYGFNYAQCEEMMTVIKTGKQGGKIWISDEYQTVWHNASFILFEKINITQNNLNLKIGKTLKKTWNHFTIEWKPKPEKHQNNTKSLKLIEISGLKNEQFTLRFPKTGDVIQPKGMKGHKKLSDVFVDKKIPLPLRKTTPVLEKNKMILWVWNVMVSEKPKIKDNVETWQLEVKIKEEKIYNM